VAPDAAVEVIETHLSWVFLTRQHAYKIKKPVDIGECRHATREARRRACVDEYWLNQALAPGVYIGVLPIVREPSGGLRVNGKGEAVEWLVKMRRLRPDRNLLWLIRHGELQASQVACLAQALASFYHTRPPQTDEVDDLVARLQRRVADSDQLLKAVVPSAHWPILDRVRFAQERYIEGGRALFNARVCDGRVIDGHGDLRPEHVFLERRPLVIDCVEYSAAVRKRDALDDLCLLAMECERLDRRDVAAQIIACHGQVTGDAGLPQLEAFYKSLHAMARAAMSGISTEELSTHGNHAKETLTCLQLAEQYAASFVRG
jgi:aminoglycoside phosphotransferase family enzyme